MGGVLLFRHYPWRFMRQRQALEGTCCRFQGVAGVTQHAEGRRV